MSDPVHVRISFSYIPEDLGPLLKLSGDTKPKSSKGMEQGKLTRGFIGWTLILGLAVLLFVWFHSDAPKNEYIATETPGWVYWTIGGLVAALAVCIYMIVFLLRAMRINFIDATKGQVAQVDISAEGLLWEGEGFSRRYEWKFFEKFNESTVAFNLISRGNTSHIIPKRVMSTEELDVVRRLLIERISPAVVIPNPRLDVWE